MAQPSSDSGNAALKTDPNASLTVWRDSVSKYLNDLVVYERALVAGNWPITIRPKTAALSQSVGAEVAVLRAAFAKGSVGELTGTVTGNSATFDAARAAETTVRSSLGLPAA